MVDGQDQDQQGKKKRVREFLRWDKSPLMDLSCLQTTIIFATGYKNIWDTNEEEGRLL